jgi:hypothetical protein
MLKISDKNLNIRSRIVNIKVDEFFYESQMMFDRIESKGLRYLKISVHDVNYKDKLNMRKRRRMIFHGYLDIHN